MAAEQVAACQRARFRLQTERVGPLPLVNHFIGRLGLEALLERYVPTTDARCQSRHATALAVLLRSIVVECHEREPIYRQQETVQGYAAELYGLTAAQRAQLSDDRLGRGLDRLFDADRAGLLTAVVVAVRERFAVDCAELHNDSTSVSFSGQYPASPERPIRGRRAAWITDGHSKDHRPDLKQLLFTLTTSADGGVPVQFRCGDGNTSDSRTHIETWEALRAVTGRADFLYVADSKLCSRENLDYIHSRGGRLLRVLPRSRLEDRHFRRW